MPTQPLNTLIGKSIAALLLAAMLASLAVLAPGTSLAPAEAADRGSSCQTLRTNGPEIRGGSSGCYYVVMASNWSKVCEGFGPIRGCYPGPGHYTVDVYANGDWSNPSKHRVYVPNRRF